MSRLFVTGGSGFIGRAVARRFRADGWETCGVDVDADPDLDVVVGDVSRPGAWQEGMQGADVVVHTAALVSNTATLDAAWSVNVCGTRNLLDAAAEAGVGRCVVFSSCALYLVPQGGVRRREPACTHLRRSLRRHEDRRRTSVPADARRGSGRRDDPASRQRHGPESGPWTILPIQMLRAGQVVLPARGEGVFVKIYAGDLVELVRLAAGSDAASGQVFNATDGASVSTREFFGHYCRMLGIGPPRTAPTPVAVALAGVVGRSLRSRPAERGDVREHAHAGRHGHDLE